MYMRQVYFAFRLLTGQDQIHQCIVRQIEESRERVHFLVGQSCFVRIEETSQDKVVFQQAPSCAPA